MSRLHAWQRAVVVRCSCARCTPPSITCASPIDIDQLVLTFVEHDATAARAAIDLDRVNHRYRHLARTPRALHDAIVSELRHVSPG